MICPSCGNDTPGTETSPGTVSSTCPPCNFKLTGRGHHPDAYDVDATGAPIAAAADVRPVTTAAKVDKRHRVKA